jgi:uncharacterized membrane protein
MELFLLNIQWMAFNVSLGVIGVVFGWLALKGRSYFRWLFLALWVLFIPNTIYMVTDMAHLTWQLPAVDPIMYLPIMVQFMLLAMVGVVTFVLGFYPFEQILHHYKRKHHFDYALLVVLIMNIFIGIGVMLGREYRLHSWYVVTQTPRVVSAVFSFFMSVELIAVALIFGIVGFVVYMLLRNDVVGFVPRKLRGELK